MSITEELQQKLKKPKKTRVKNRKWVTIGIKVPKELKDKFFEICKKTGKAPSNVGKSLIEECLQKITEST